MTNGKIVASPVSFYGPLAVKRALRGPLSNPRVVAPGIYLRDRTWMLRGSPAEPDDLAAGRELLARRLWTRRVDRPDAANWRELLHAHVRRIYPSPNLLVRVWALPRVKTHRAIHGDATLANLVRYPVLGVRWVDALRRPYVPGDPLVDVGKMLQSAWGYEEVLAGGRAAYDARLGAIATGVDELNREETEAATTWLCVHLARLLRYHDDRVAGEFRAVLEDVYECRL